MGVRLFDDLISDAWRLERKGAYWIVREAAKDSNNKEVSIGGCPTIAFSLDKTGENPLPFVKDNCPKSGIRSVCDAMIVFIHQERTYFCAMDLKSGKEGDATRQIETGRHLFQWLIGLAHLNGHWPDVDLNDCFFGIVNLAPRNQIRKGVTQRSAEIPAPDLSPFGAYKIFRLRNHPRVTLPLLVGQLH
jgi:hypothetical protein